MANGGDFRILLYKEQPGCSDHAKGGRLRGSRDATQI